MAGDWIKIEHTLPHKPEVMQIASILDIDEMAVVGHLVLFWTWVDANLSPDCPATIGTKRGLDRASGRDGFTDALIEVGWLRMDGNKVSIPNYDHHLSESAKKRALETRKKQRQRDLSRNHRDKNGDNIGTTSGPEKRREEINTPPCPHQKSPAYQRLIPANQAAVDRWAAYWLVTQDKQWHDTQCESAIEQAIRKGLLPKLPEVIDFSIEKNRKSWGDPADDFDKHRKPSAAKGEPLTGGEKPTATIPSIEETRKMMMGSRYVPNP